MPGSLFQRGKALRSADWTSPDQDPADRLATRTQFGCFCLLCLPLGAFSNVVWWSDRPIKTQSSVRSRRPPCRTDGIRLLFAVFVDAFDCLLQCDKVVRSADRSPIPSKIPPIALPLGRNSDGFGNFLDTFGCFFQCGKVVPSADRSLVPSKIPPVASPLGRNSDAWGSFLVPSGCLFK